MRFFFNVYCRVHSRDKCEASLPVLCQLMSLVFGTGIRDCWTTDVDQQILRSNSLHGNRTAALLLCHLGQELVSAFCLSLTTLVEELIGIGPSGWLASDSPHTCDQPLPSSQSTLFTEQIKWVGRMTGMCRSGRHWG